MTPRSPSKSDRPLDQTRETQRERLLDRLEQTERRLLQVENALKGVAHVSNLSVAGPCGECTRSLLLVKQELVYCPACGYQELV